jgi:hypothetical protein
MGVRNLRHAVVFAVVGALIVSTAPFTARPQAQMAPSCAREISRLDASTRAFHENLEKQNLDFAWSDATGQTLTDTKDLLQGQPDEIALRKLKDIKSSAIQYADDMMSTKATMDRLLACLNGGPSGCLTGIVSQQKERFRRWINSLADYSVSDASKRVKDAGSLLEGYAMNAASMAQGGMMRGLDACIDETQKSVDRRTSTVDTRPAGARPTGDGATAAAAPPPDSDGLSGGAKALIVLGVAGGTGLLAKDAIAEALKTGAGGSCAGSPPDVSACYTGNGNGPGCQPALAALDAYCASCGMKRGTLGSATDCVAK